MKPNKLKRSHDTARAECVGRTNEFLHRKLNEFNNQEQALAKIITVTSKPLRASSKLPTELPKMKNPIRMQIV
jgi:hypothetical protein